MPRNANNDEASAAVKDAPVLASGLSPLDGVLVPSFGAFYLAVTLLFPFVAIRTLGREKDSGALRLLVQLPYRVATLVGAKTAAISIVWLVAIIPALSALAIWAILGGHLHPAETADLLFGHLLYGLLVGAIALFAAAVSDGAATAAIVTLAFTIGSWVLDFALAGQPGLPRQPRLGALPPRRFERRIAVHGTRVPHLPGRRDRVALG